MTAPQFKTSAEAFMWSALVQECRNSPHLQNVDFSRASLSLVREMLNHNTALEINKIPILLSKYLVRLALVNVKPFIPAVLSSHLTPENIRVEIESDELQLLLTRSQSAQPSMVTLVAKNVLCAVIGSSLDALRTALVDGPDKRPTQPNQLPPLMPITVAEPEPIAVPPRSVPGQFTNVFDASGLDRFAPSPARSGSTGAAVAHPVDAFAAHPAMAVSSPRSAKRSTTTSGRGSRSPPLGRSPLGSTSNVSGSVTVQPGSSLGGEGNPEPDPVEAESDGDDEEPSSGDDRDRVYDLNALYGAAGDEEFASSGYGDEDGGGDGDDSEDDDDYGTEEIPTAGGGDGDDHRPEKVLLGAKLTASAPDFTALVIRKRPRSRISDGSRSPVATIATHSDPPAAEPNRKRLAVAAESDPGTGPFVVIASGDDSDGDSNAATEAYSKPTSNRIDGPGGSGPFAAGVPGGGYTGTAGDDDDDADYDDGDDGTGRF